MNHEIAPLPNFQEKKPEELLNKWRVKSASILVNLFEEFIDPKGRFVFLNNGDHGTSRIEGLFSRAINGKTPGFSFKEWHPDDLHLPFSECRLTLSLYDDYLNIGEDFFPFWRLHVDKNCEDILPTDLRQSVYKTVNIHPEFNDLINIVNKRYQELSNF